MAKDNTIVFIDNAYLYLVAKHFGKAGQFDINQFAITIAKEQNLWCEHVFLYTAPPYQSAIPTEDENKRRAKYDNFIAHMKKIHTFTIREGRCQRINNEYKQKGVDTLMVMDLSSLPILFSKIKTIIIVTSDTDFVPILNHLRETHQICVILYNYSDYVRKSRFSMSNHLFTACDQSVMVTSEHFERSKLIRKSI